MRVGLVTPTGSGPDSNPGCAMITAGIRWLLREAVPGVEFVDLDMHRAWNEAETQVARGCDVLALCGNPRFDTGDHQWLYSGAIRQMSECDRPMVDLFAGACVPLGGESGAVELLASERNREILGLLERFSGIVTRDDLARRVVRTAGLRSVRLPCSSWWAADEYGIEPRRRTRRVLVPIRGTDPDIVARLAEGREIVAVVGADAHWCADHGLAVTLACDPAELLALLAECEEVVSFRLHAGIPAASLGARVVLAAIDSRSQAGEAFGIPWADYRDPLPAPALATEPMNPVPALREVMNAN